MLFKNLRRTVGFVVAVCLLLTALAPNAVPNLYVSAQDGNTVSIDGSNIMSPVLKTAVGSYTAKNPNAKITVGVSGTGGGFDKLCGGSLDINMAVRAILDTELANCKQKNVNVVELVIGYDALVVVVGASSKITCLTNDQLNKAFGPGANGIKNWKDVDSTLGDNPMSAVYIPPTDSQTYVLADSIIAGDKLRPDAQIVPNATSGLVPAVATKVSGDQNSVGLIDATDYSKTSSQGLAIKALQLNGGQGCTDSTVPNLEEGRYGGGETLYLYVNAASLGRTSVSDFLTYLLSTDGQAAVTSNNFTAASSPTYDLDSHYLTLRQTGRTFSRIQSVQVPANTPGTIEVDGSPDLFPVLKAINDAFSPRYTSIKVDNVEYGDTVGFTRLCSNNVDLIGTSRLPTDADLAACQKANVQTLHLLLGVNAEVVVVNGDNKFATCLTTDQISTIFGLDSEGKVKKWSDVSKDFPATDLLVLAPTDGSSETDLLLGTANPKAVAPLRRKDTTDNDDPLYRAAGTQNVAGAVTYMTFTDYQKVKSKVHTVQINAGKGCVDPTQANITNGTYALARPLYVILNLNSFSRPDIKAFVWYMLNDESLAVIAKQPLVGTDTAGIVAARDIALARFSQTAPSPAGTAAATGQANSAVSPASTAAATTAAATQSAPGGGATTAATVATTAATGAATAVPPANATAASTTAK